MAARNKPYEQFGEYILFKKLESDSLSELWRAARIENGQVGSLVALRRFTGGNREALTQAASHAKHIVGSLTGTSFAKNQIIDVINGVPFIAHDYAGGRSLRHIVDRARGGGAVTPNPIPIDQAIVVAEKIALSLATTSELRLGNDRLMHGALLPQLVWISDDGEIRVAGQQLGAGIHASLRDAKVATEISRYFAPEYQSSGQATKSSEVYSMGAVLFLLVTGVEPPDAMNASAFMSAIRAGKTMTGTPIPDDIRIILDKSLTIDAGFRYGSAGDMKTAISALAHGGKYSATTFNLAFYVSNLLKKEHESEALDRDKEMKLNVAPYIESLSAPAPMPVAAATVPSSAPMFNAVDDGAPSKSKAPLAIAAAVIVAAIGGGAWFMLRSKTPTTTTTAPKPVTASMMPTAPKPQLVSQPLVAAAPTTTAAATDTAAIEAAKKKAFEAAVEQQLQNEMMKLQKEYTNNLQKQQSKNAPVPVAAAPAPSSDSSPSAAQLDQQRLANRTETVTPTPQPAVPAIAQTQSSAPAPAVATPAPVAPAVREGDIVDVSALDTPPKVTRPSLPQYPPMAVRQRAEATILVTALVSENGDVIDVKVLRGDQRFGFIDAALRAVRATKFSAPIKDGKRVKTWYPLPVTFKL